MLTNDTRKILIVNIVIALGTLLLLLLIVQWSLKSYTRHGEAIEVEELTGKNITEVESILKKQGLELKVIDSVFDASKPPLSVVDQNPRKGSKVKTGRVIYVTLNASTAPTTEIPDLIGKSSFKYAKMQLESYGLKVGEPVYQPDPHLNAVIGMEINGRPVNKKMRVPKGTEVILVLGDGLSSGSIQLPYLIGLRLDEAIFKLRGNSLNVGAVVQSAEVSDSLNAIVWKQSPEFKIGRQIRMGETVDLWTDKNLPAGITVEPSYYDLEVDTTE